MSVNPEEYSLTTVDVARMLGMKRDSVRRAALRGRIPSVKILGSVRFRRKDIEALIEVREKK